MTAVTFFDGLTNQRHSAFSITHFTFRIPHFTHPNIRPKASARFGSATLQHSAELRPNFGIIRFRFCTQVCSLYCLYPESVLQELAFFAAITN